MKYKLLALDIDGTIVKEGTELITQPVADALRKASEKVAVSLVTARSLDHLKQFVQLLGCPKAYHIAENGAKIITPEGEIVRDLHIPHAEVQEIINSVTGHFSEVGFLSDNHWLDEEVDMPYASLINGLSFSCDDEIHALMLHETVQRLPQGYASFVIHHWLVPEWSGVMVFHKEATKGLGMKYIQEKLNISVEETIAVGDGGTDIAMYEYAGLKVAMGNAEEVLKKNADITIPSVDEDGLVELINRFLLE